MIDNKKLALIHITRRELGLSDRQYRDILWKAAGVRSAKDLDDARFKKLLYYFARSKHYRVEPGGLTIRQKLFIQHLARKIGWDERHLDNFIRKYYRKPRLDELTGKEAVKLIEALKNISARYKPPPGGIEKRGEGRK